MKIYTAGKTWHAKMFQHMRDVIGLPIEARWIDLEADSDLVKNEKGKLWDLCLRDVSAADFVFLYCGDTEEEQRGALVEIGIAMGLGKRIYAYGKCKSIMPTEHSDVAFTHHPLWKWVEAENAVKALFYAIGLEIGTQTKNRKAA